MDFNKIEQIEQAISQMDIKVLEIAQEALFLTGKFFNRKGFCEVPEE
jgi:hypothetical protein